MVVITSTRGFLGMRTPPTSALGVSGLRDGRIGPRASACVPQAKATPAGPAPGGALGRAGPVTTSRRRPAPRELVPGETAILICDTWNQHWCKSATRRCGAVGREDGADRRASPRSRECHIVHAPSDTLGFLSRPSGSQAGNRRSGRHAPVADRRLVLARARARGRAADRRLGRRLRLPAAVQELQSLDPPASRHSHR